MKEISPWEILEGVKNSGPLMLSWFGAVRMKRKPLWFEEQRHLVRFHTHQNQFQSFISGPNTVKLPSEEEVQVPSLPPVGPTPTTDANKTLASIDSTQNNTAKPPSATGGTPGSSAVPTNQVSNHPSNVGIGGTGVHPAIPSANYPSGMQHPMMNPRFQQHYMVNRPRNPEQLRTAEQMRMRLKKIQEINLVNQPQMNMPPPMYPGGMGMAMNYNHLRRQQHLHVMQQHHLTQQRKLHLLRMQQQQQQMHQQQLMGPQYAQYRTQPGPMHSMRPMQANPPMQMHQVIQQRQYATNTMMPPPSITPGGQPGMQFPPQQAPGMGQVMHRPPGLY